MEVQLDISDLIQVPVEPLPSDRARKALEKIDLLRKIREEVICNPHFIERLNLCLPSLDLPEWWIPGKHDQDLVLAAARLFFAFSVKHQKQFSLQWE